MRFPNPAACCLAAALLAVSRPVRADGLEPGRGSPDDLAVSGLFTPLAPGATAHFTRASLEAMPGVVKIHERVKPELPEVDLEVLPLLELFKAVPPAAGADGIVLIGADSWESFLPMEFVKTYHPYVLLRYDGRTPAGGWPKVYGIKPLAPYFSDISPSLGPKLETPLEYGYNDANQMVEIRAVVTKDRYAPFFEGKLAGLSPAAAMGRKTFLRECSNCHLGPGHVGGNVAHRSFALLSAQATLSKDYFIHFVRNSTLYLPETVMAPYDQMSPAEMDGLVAFLQAARAAGVE